MQNITGSKQLRCCVQLIHQLVYYYSNQTHESKHWDTNNNYNYDTKPEFEVAIRSAAVQNSSITGCQLAQLSSFTSNSMTSPGSLRYVHQPQSITNRNVNMSFLTDQYIYMHVIIMTAIFLSESSAAVYMVIITLHMVTTAAKNTFRNLFQSPWLLQVSPGQCYQ